MISENNWYCCDKCAELAGAGARERDHIRNHSVAITWNGLLDLCQRDVTREADGPGMIKMWRINMLRFWPQHNKYMIIGHRLLAGSNIINPLI